MCIRDRHRQAGARDQWPVQVPDRRREPLEPVPPVGAPRPGWDWAVLAGGQVASQTRHEGASDARRTWPPAALDSRVVDPVACPMFFRCRLVAQWESATLTR